MKTLEKAQCHRYPHMRIYGHWLTIHVLDGSFPLSGPQREVSLSLGPKNNKLYLLFEVCG